jgi:hypothetical protein
MKAEIERLNKIIDEQNGLLAKLGCPTIACARRLVHEKELLKSEKLESALLEIYDYLRSCENCIDVEKLKDFIFDVIEDKEKFKNKIL